MTRREWPVLSPPFFIVAFRRRCGSCPGPDHSSWSVLLLPRHNQQKARLRSAGHSILPAVDKAADHVRDPVFIGRDKV